MYVGYMYVCMYVGPTHECRPMYVHFRYVTRMYECKLPLTLLLFVVAIVVIYYLIRLNLLKPTRSWTITYRPYSTVYVQRQLPGDVYH